MITNKLYFQYLVILIIIIGICLRLYNLIEQSYWLDELVSIKISNPKNSLNTVIEETLKGAPPLFQILLWYWFKLLNFNEFNGRLFSVFFGSISLPLFYLLGKELFNKNVGLFALIIASTNQFLIYFSQEARAYSLLLFFTLLSTILFVRNIIRDKNKNYYIYLFIILCTIYTHYYGFLILGFHLIILVLFYKEKNKFKLLSIGLIIIVVSTIPLFLTIFNVSKIDDFWVPKPKFYFWLTYFYIYFKSKFLFILFGGLIFLNWFLYKKKEYSFNIIILVLWIVVTYSIPYIRSVFSTPMLIEKYTIITLPAYIILISSGLYYIRGNIIKANIIFLIFVYSIFNLSQNLYYEKITKQQWRSALKNVYENNKNNYPIYDIVFKGEFYETYADLLDLNINIKNKDQFINDFTHNRLPDKFWILDAHQDNFNKYFRDNNQIIEVKKFKNANAYLLKK